MSLRAPSLATGKTGSRVAQGLADRGTSVRRAARNGADVHFDWSDPKAFEPALRGVSGIYLVSPGKARRLRGCGVAGRAYAPTGPEALTFEEAARLISIAVGRKITYRDIDRNAWINAMINAGAPAEYGEVLRSLTETVASGHGSRPNGDVLMAIGTAPTRFEEFALKTASAWR